MSIPRFFQRILASFLSVLLKPAAAVAVGLFLLAPGVPYVADSSVYSAAGTGIVQESSHLTDKVVVQLEDETYTTMDITKTVEPGESITVYATSSGGGLSSGPQENNPLWMVLLYLVLGMAVLGVAWGALYVIATTSDFLD